MSRELIKFRISIRTQPFDSQIGWDARPVNSFVLSNGPSTIHHTGIL